MIVSNTMEDCLSKIGSRISELMFNKSINTKELAEILGVKAASVYRWKRGSKYPRLKYLVGMADSFNCSLQFLTGRSDNLIDFEPRACPPIYERLRTVIEKAGKNVNQVNTETDIKDSYFTKGKQGQEPHILTLIGLADYLGITLDFLIGREI